MWWWARSGSTSTCSSLLARSPRPPRALPEAAGPEGPGGAAPTHPGRRGALAGGWLIGGLVAALAGTILVGLIPLPGGNVPPPPVAATVLLLCVTGAGWGFGRALARVAGFPAGEGRRLARAGAIGYGLAAGAAGSLLGVAEPALSALVERGAAPPMHIVFGLLFSGATGLVALITGAALGWAAGGLLQRAGAAAPPAEPAAPDPAPGGAEAPPLHPSPARLPAPWRLAARLGLSAAGAAALAFAAVDLLLDLAGRRVGAPGAAETATMMTVMGVGLIAAAAALGAVLGRGLARARDRAGAAGPGAGR